MKTIEGTPQQEVSQALKGLRLPRFKASKLSQFLRQNAYTLTLFVTIVAGFTLTMTAWAPTTDAVYYLGEAPNGLGEYFLQPSQEVESIIFVSHEDLAEWEISTNIEVGERLTATFEDSTLWTIVGLERE